ncbi:MAG: amidohydrolase [Candidatus Tectimicrobiota bacterium]|nr:MAG: amidohydrolase [Candidatus Tectomicrobia bacterium]
MRLPYPVIDGDSHVLEPRDLWLQRLEEPFRPQAPQFRLTPEGKELFYIDGKWQKRVPFEGNVWEDRPRGGFDPHERLRVMDALGIDQTFLYPTLGLNLAAVENVPLAAALCRAYNDWLADYCRVAPQRLFGVAALNLEEPREAIREAQRVVATHGVKAVMIRPNPSRGRCLHHPDYEPFYAALADLGVALAVHEGTTGTMPTAGIDRFDNNFFFEHLFSHPFEQQLAFASFLAGGILERHPTLRVAFLEAGTAWVPYWLHRLDEHYEGIGWMVPELRQPPSEYFRRQGWVSCEPDDALLPHLLPLIGEDKVMFSTDYPHYDAKPEPVKLFLELALPETARRRILGENAARFYGLTT